MLDVNMLFLVSEEEVEKLIEEGIGLLGEVGVDKEIIDTLAGGHLEQKVSFIGAFLPLMVIEYLHKQVDKSEGRDRSNILDIMKLTMRIRNYTDRLEKCLTFVGKDVIPGDM